jgi:hypothetical protein
MLNGTMESSLAKTIKCGKRATMTETADCPGGSRLT